MTAQSISQNRPCKLGERRVTDIFNVSTASFAKSSVLQIPGTQDWNTSNIKLFFLLCFTVKLNDQNTISTCSNIPDLFWPKELLLQVEIQATGLNKAQKFQLFNIKNYLIRVQCKLSNDTGEVCSLQLPCARSDLDKEGKSKGNETLSSAAESHTYPVCV